MCAPAAMKGGGGGEERAERRSRRRVVQTATSPLRRKECENVRGGGQNKLFGPVNVTLRHCGQSPNSLARAVVV